MVWRPLALSLVVLGTLAEVSLADPAPPPPSRPALNGQATAALAAQLRSLLLESLPDPLYQAAPGWGKTAPALTGVKLSGKDGRLRLKGKRAEKNQGTWRSVRVTGVNLPQTLFLDIRDLKQVQPGRSTFSVLLAFDARVDYHQQKWVKGVRVSADTVRARFRVRAILDCECSSRVESKGWFPDVVFQLKVLRSDLHYDNVVCEHIDGFGGSTARLLGDFVLRVLHKRHPALERKLLAKANAAVVKAGSTREVRIGLGKLLKK
jgi:hypothetical protein